MNLLRHCPVARPPRGGDKPTWPMAAAPGGSPPAQAGRWAGLPFGQPFGLTPALALGLPLGLALGMAFGLPLVIGAVASATGTAPAAVTSLLLVAPLCEELVFRAGLQQQLIQRGQRPAVAVLATAAAFALLHGLSRSAALGLAVLGPALLLGALYQRSRSLPACVAAHAAMNLAWLLALGPAITAALPAR